MVTTPVVADRKMSVYMEEAKYQRVLQSLTEHTKTESYNRHHDRGKVLGSYLEGAFQLLLCRWETGHQGNCLSSCDSISCEKSHEFCNELWKYGYENCCIIVSICV
jgi:hypothetical protein